METISWELWQETRRGIENLSTNAAGIALVCWSVNLHMYWSHSLRARNGEQSEGYQRGNIRNKNMKRTIGINIRYALSVLSPSYCTPVRVMGYRNEIRVDLVFESFCGGFAYI